jgi:hypothetical protein
MASAMTLALAVILTMIMLISAVSADAEVERQMQYALSKCAIEQGYVWCDVKRRCVKMADEPCV